MKNHIPNFLINHKSKANLSTIALYAETIAGRGKGKLRPVYGGLG